MKKQWKRLAALSSAAVMAAGTLLYFPIDTLQNISWGITASAEETGTVTWTQTESDNLTWTLYDNGTLTISGEGAMKNYYNNSPATQKKDNIKKVVIEDGVTSIGNFAFRDCSSLTSIEIPSSVTSIGDYAFYNCNGLTGITIPNSVTSIGNGAFSDCSSLASITIPESVTSIGNFAFCGCIRLTDITIPGSVTSIGINVFGDCTVLTEVLLENGSTLTSESLGVDASIIKTYWNEDNLTWTLTADGTMTISGTGAMKEDYNIYYSPAHDNKNIKKVVIEDGVTSIGEYAFSGCSMTSITIPDSVKSIGDSAFEWCTGLTSIEIPEGVTSIGEFVFFGCYNLTEVFLENGSKLTSGNLGVNESIIGTYWNEGDLTWTLTADGTLTISGTGAMKDYSYDSPACDNSNIKKVVIEEDVTSIGDSAFSYCSSLTDITIPGSVTSIGNDAFSWCTSLTGITIPSSVTSIGNGAFSGCSSLTDITIPSSVTSIGESAFESCTDLTNITIPKSVTSIGSNVFDGCTALTEVLLEGGSTLTSENFGEVANKVVIRWNEDNLTWTLTADGTLTISGTGAMKEYGVGSSPAAQKKDSVKKVVIEDGITNIVDFAFFDCTVLESIEIPGSVASIGNFAFCSCIRLTDITIPGSVTSIGDYAFLNCTGLTSINIPEGVTSIEDYAFQGCSSLTSITIPESVTSIGNYAFKYCSSLTDITIPGSVTSIGTYAFSGCTALTEVLLENGSTLTSENFGEVADKVVTRWNEGNLTWTLDAEGTMAISGTGAMKDYSSSDSPATQKKDSVNKVVIQQGVTSIGELAFSGCTNLTDITIPSSVTSIGDYAFFECTDLTSINIPESVTNIGEGAFSNCRNLASIEIPESVTSIGDFAFFGCGDSLEITVSCDSTLKKDAFGNASEKVKYRHSLVKTDAKDATYTEVGNVEYWTCENCKKHFLSDETDVETAKEVELSEIVKPVPVQVATATTQIKCVYGQDMDEINLQDYVKNADAVGGVFVKVATGSTMLNGMQLEGSKLSGKPAKAYTDGREVTFTFTAKNGNTANLTLHFLVAKADPTVKVTVDGDSHTEGDLVEKLGLSISKDSTKGAAKIVSKLKKLIAGKNTLAWEFTPEDSENYNVVTGTVVVNAQTTTTTTTTTTNETTETTEETTTSETTATTEETTTTNETTATTKATTVTTNETTATTEKTTTTSETTATTEETTTTSETTVTTEETTTTNETTATTEETTITNETTATTEATTVTTSGTTVTTKETITTNETTATTKATTATNGTAATSGTTSATKATTATTNGTTSATQTTTTTKESTTASETTMTTSTSNTESTAATSATTITTAATTSVTNIADDDLCSWAINDYQKKAGIVPANAEITARSEEACEITLTDESGNVLDVYTVDPKTGTGTDSSNAEVNLPQTGNNSMTNWLLCVGAAMFMAFGFGAVKASGVLKRKEDE